MDDLIGFGVGVFIFFDDDDVVDDYLVDICWKEYWFVLCCMVLNGV